MTRLLSIRTAIRIATSCTSSNVCVARARKRPQAPGWGEVAGFNSPCLKSNKWHRKCFDFTIELWRWELGRCERGKRTCGTAASYPQRQAIPSTSGSTKFSPTPGSTRFKTHGENGPYFENAPGRGVHYCPNHSEPSTATC